MVEAIAVVGADDCIDCAACCDTCNQAAIAMAD
jgi:NAD-dependent dihydropyrimidine dehydrogenase PreA subunit